MAQTVQDVQNDLLGMLGISSAAGTTPYVLARILADINSVRQRMFLVARRDFWLITSTGVYVLGPTSLTGLSVAQYATTLSGPGLASWMDGCTVSIAGDANQNRIIQTSADTYALETPYIGQTNGSAGLTVYQDCITRPTGALSVLRPVMCEGQRELIPLDSEAQLRSGYGVHSTDYGQWSGSQNNGSGYPVVALPRPSGVPRTYLMSKLQDYGGDWHIRMRLHPMPDSVYVIKFQERQLPSAITSLSDTSSILCPHGFEESVFTPLVRFAFSTFPLFTGNEALCKEQAADALAALKETGDGQKHHDRFFNMRAGW